MDRMGRVRGGRNDIVQRVGKRLPSGDETGRLYGLPPSPCWVYKFFLISALTSVTIVIQRKGKT